jgi:invasion protein IalB
MWNKDTHAASIGRGLATMAFVMVTALAAQVQAQAQQPTPKAKAPAPKAQPTAPAAPQAQQPQQPGAAEPQLVYSPWTKVCPKGGDSKTVCLTGRDGSVESGLPVVAAVLIEPEGETKKILRITLPLGMALQPGTRVVIDQGQPMTAPYAVCLQNGCMADYEVSAELIGNMKKGKGLAVQGLNGSGQVVTVVLPLADFGKVHDGAPTDPKAFEEQQRKRFEEVQKRQEESMKKQQQQH